MSSKTDYHQPLELCHDLIQVLTNQGIPPASMKDWQKIYENGGATLIQCYHNLTESKREFVHVVSLKNNIYSESN